MRRSEILKVLAIALAVGLVPGCSDDDDGGGVVTPTPVNEAEVVREALDAYLDSGTAPTITAQDVFDRLNDGDATNDPYVLSVRSADHYALGHLPGSANVPWREICSEASLASIPTGKDVVVYCYTGHTGAVATTALRALGYDAINMKFGIMSWTPDPVIRASAPFDETVDAHDFAVETTANTPTETFALPTFDLTTSSDARDIILAAGHDHVSTDAPVMSAIDLFDILNEPDWEDSYVVLSVRSADHYAIGHVPGAINIPWREVAKVENLAKLDPSKTIVVYCYTGHTAGCATAALGMLGYDAVNLKHGIMSWTTDPAVRVIAPFSEVTDGHDYPLEP